MSKKEYAEVLKWVMKSQIDYVRDEAKSGVNTIEEAAYYEGIEKGLQIAMDKIEASMFLTEE